MKAIQFLIIVFTAIVSYITIFTGLLIAYWAFTVISPTIGLVWTGIFSLISIGYAIYYGVTAYNKMEN
jgi:hypothetical protein